MQGILQSEFGWRHLAGHVDKYLIVKQGNGKCLTNPGPSPQFPVEGNPIL